MHRPSSKSLTVQRETLRVLVSSELHSVGGGGDTLNVSGTDEQRSDPASVAGSQINPTTPVNSLVFACPHADGDTKGGVGKPPWPV